MKGIALLSIIIIFMFTSCNSLTDKTAMPLKFKWKIAGTLPNDSDGSSSLGIAGPVVGVSNDRLIIGGGSNFPNGFPWDGGKKEYYNSVYVFKKEGNSVINVKRNLPLPYRVAYSANCTTEKGIVVAGGENEEGALDKVLLLNWDRDNRNLKIRSLPDLPQPLTAGAIINIKNNIYFAGGQNADVVSDKLYHLDLSHLEKGWEILSQLPSPVTHAVLYAQFNGRDSCLYLVGGRKKNPDSVSVLYKDVYQFDPGTGRWSQKAALPYTVSAHTGLSWGDSTLLVFSGDQGEAFHATELLLMKIAKENDPASRKQLIKEKNELQESHAGFAGNVLAYNTYTDRWRNVDSIPFPGQVTTTAVKWGDDIVIPCGEVSAGIRTPDIIIGVPF